MGPLPQLVRQMAGERQLQRALGRAGLPAAVLERPGTRILLADLVTLFDVAAREVGDPGLGLRVGQAMRATDYGTFVRWAAAAPTLGQALARVVRAVGHYQRPGVLTFDVRSDRACLAYGADLYGAGQARQHADHVLGPMVHLARLYLGPGWRPAEVRVPYSRDRQETVLEEAFEAPVRFDAAGVGIVLQRELLRTPHAGPPPPPPSRAELRSLVLGGEPTLARTVRDIALLHLEHGSAELARVATRLALHPRRLQRLLAAEGTSFRAVLDGVRLERAERLLAEPGARIADVALAAGYEEPAHFTRAFRRWRGVSPSAFRQAVEARDR
jgi:AraC-like DNA-binding protein